MSNKFINNKGEWDIAMGLAAVSRNELFTCGEV